jgi:hypothetical protein
MKRDHIFIILSLVLVAALGAAVYYFDIPKKLTQSQMNAVKDKAEKFINEQLVAPGTQAKIKDIIEESGLYKISVSVGEQDLTAYISKDGKSFFPQAFDMDAAEASSTPETAKGNQVISPKDVPDVELFVMSYCPFGLQMEKGILPVVELLGSKINFQLKFVSYAMHGEKEIDENVRQYCIQKMGFDKLDAYLKCFVKQDDSAGCLSAAKIDTANLNSCVSQTDAKFQIKEKFKDQSSWSNGQYPPFDINKDDNVKYDVSGSPSLVINGTLASAERTPQSLLNLICSGFTNQPAECGQQLSSDAPTSGFGEGTATSSTDSSCNN